MAEETKPIGGRPVPGAAPQTAPAASPQQQQARPCPQDCTKCPMPQQVFCATKMLFDLSRSQQTLRDQMSELTKAVGTLQDQMRPKESDGQLSIPFIDQK